MSATATNRNGFILFEGGGIVVIATGFRRPSRNTKTKNMIQVWVLGTAIHPLEAVRTGADRIVCGNCARRPLLVKQVNAKRRRGEQKEKKCYVRVGQAPAKVWKCYRRGGYAVLPGLDVFTGRQVRWGAYGGPEKIPFPIVAGISAVADGWTGYTHQWRHPLLQGYRRYFMASVDDIEQQIEATKLGWRTFRTSQVGSSFRLRDEVKCPASAEAGKKSDCARCGLCAGTSVPAKSVEIWFHGGGGK